jgi:hypothetical protein
MPHSEAAESEACVAAAEAGLSAAAASVQSLGEGDLARLSKQLEELRSQANERYADLKEKVWLDGFSLVAPSRRGVPPSDAQTEAPAAVPVCIGTRLSESLCAAHDGGPCPKTRRLCTTRACVLPRPPVASLSRVVCH